MWFPETEENARTNDTNGSSPGPSIYPIVI